MEGHLFLEVFAGDAAFTLGVLMSQVPCIRPWDNKFGREFDVLQHGSVLLALARSGRLAVSHLGTPCQSMTWCRQPQLRSIQYPDGLPDLTGKQSQLVLLGNSLMSFTVRYCTELYKAGG